MRQLISTLFTPTLQLTDKSSIILSDTIRQNDQLMKTVVVFLDDVYVCILHDDFEDDFISIHRARNKS